MGKRLNIILRYSATIALHIACAESANVDVLLTTDDRLLRNAQSQTSAIEVKVANPVAWLMEVSKPEGDA
jgi:predicted nucleic acid-binding protein